MMRRYVGIGVLVLATTGCGDFEVGDLNNPSVSRVMSEGTRSQIAALSVGLLIGHREDVAAPNGYVATLGVLGREAYNLDVASDPRFVTELLAGENLDPGSPRFGGNFWSQPYANIRNANLLLAVLEKSTALTLSEAAAVRGFARTIQALDYLVIVNTRDTNGGPIVTTLDSVESDVDATKEELLAHVAMLLEEGMADLERGGPDFPFRTPAGLEDFPQPRDFRKVNRALAARVAAYRGDYEGVLEALGRSFLTADAANPQLDLGFYHSFGLGQGDETNRLMDSNLYAHPSVFSEAEVRLDGSLDERVAYKMQKVPVRRESKLESDLRYIVYERATSPVCIIRNEELILLRAEARLMLGQTAEAAEDLNFIRVHAGGLDRRLDLNADNMLDELLRQRRYSLLFEGHRWIDMRRFGRLEELPVDRDGDRVHARFPIPLAEMDARK